MKPDTVPSANQGWGPARRRAALSVTFDNLGEASALEKGKFPASASIGKHPTATSFLQSLLRVIEHHPITYFVEASNCLIYPDALKSIRDAGHEIGLHAWRHEKWSAQDAAQRPVLLSRGIDAFRALGIDVKGFRPPGGMMPPGSVKELADAGLTYCSGLGVAGHTSMEDAILMLPFAWEHVDAFVLDPELDALRAAFQVAREPRTVNDWAASLRQLVRHTVSTGTYTCVVFHPYYLHKEPAAFEVFVEFLDQLGSETELWLPTCAEAANWMAQSDPPRANPTR